jgi:putative ABC transport system permease protein
MLRRAVLATLIAAAVVISLVAQSPTPSVSAPPSSPDVPALPALPAPPPSELPTVLVTRQLLESQHLAIGQVISLSSEPSGGNPRPFRIVGQYEPVPDPMRLGAVRHEVRMHLPDLLATTADHSDPLDLDSVDTINVSVTDKATIADLRRDLMSRIPGVVAASTGGGAAEPFVVLERFHYAIAIVTVIASSIFLLALMLMLVDERRATVGILRLIGFRRRRIVWHVLVEGLVIALAGAVFGILLSAAFQGGVNQFFQWKYDTALVFVRITPSIALRSVAISVPLGVVATLVSSWSILRRDVFALARR